MHIYTPYTYFIGWSALNKYYYGVRYARSHSCLYETGCHPDDLMITYFTSSPTVKSFINQHGLPDIIQVRRVFDNKESACIWEQKVLRRMGVAQRDDFINENLGYGPPLRNGRKDSQYALQMKRERMKGSGNHMYGMIGELHPNYGISHTEETKNKISAANSGEKHAFFGKKRPEHSEKLRGSNHFNYGKPLRDEVRIKISQTTLQKPKQKCLYCDFEHHIKGHIVRYHNENCKHKPC